MLQFLCLASCFATTFEVPQHSLYLPSGMEGQVRLVRDSDHRFTAIVNGTEEFHIQNHNIRGLPKRVTNEQLSQADIYFRLNRIDKDAVLEANMRLRGGGWLKDIGKGIVKVGKGTIKVTKFLVREAGPIIVELRKVF